MTQIDFPLRIDGRGRIASTTEDEHIRDMIEQFLLTSPGERVNRPDFGSGLLAMAFEPNTPELAAALQTTILAGLQRGVGDVIEPRTVSVTANEGRLAVLVEYVVRSTGAVERATFETGAPA
jgi:phage baseplate assembly protein W